MSFATFAWRIEGKHERRHDEILPWWRRALATIVHARYAGSANRYCYLRLTAVELLMSIPRDAAVDRMIDAARQRWVMCDGVFR